MPNADPREWKGQPFQQGDRVRTLAQLGTGGFTFQGQLQRVPDAFGVVVDLSNSHGLCFEVKHDIEGTAWYNGEELEHV